MPLSIPITQATGAIATYHVVVNCEANFVHGGISNASVTINSYLDADSFSAGREVLGSLNQVDISPLVNSPATAAPSLLTIIEAYLLTTVMFFNAIQVS